MLQKKKQKKKHTHTHIKKHDTLLSWHSFTKNKILGIDGILAELHLQATFWRFFEYIMFTLTWPLRDHLSCSLFSLNRTLDEIVHSKPMHAFWISITLVHVNRPWKIEWLTLRTSLHMYILHCMMMHKIALNTYITITGSVSWVVIGTISLT